MEATRLVFRFVPPVMVKLESSSDTEPVPVSAIVPSVVATLATLAAVNLPCWSTVNVGI